MKRNILPGAPPAQWHSLAADPAHTQRIAEMRARFSELKTAAK